MSLFPSLSGAKRSRGTCSSRQKLDEQSPPLRFAPVGATEGKQRRHSLRIADHDLKLGRLLSPSLPIVCSRITNFWILPVTVIGNSATNSM